MRMRQYPRSEVNPIGSRKPETLMLRMKESEFMRMATNRLFVSSVLLIFSLLAFDSQPARAQAIQILQLENQVKLHVNGNSSFPPPNVDLETNLVTLDFSQSESDSNSTNGSSANGSVTQMSVTTLQSNYLYVTCTTSAGASAGSVPLPTSGSDAEAQSVFLLVFNVSVPCYYTVVASANYSAPEVVPEYNGAATNYTTNYPTCFVEFNAGRAFVTAGQGYLANSGQATGTIDTGVQGLIEVNARADAQGFGNGAGMPPGAPLSAALGASATVTLTIYPQSPSTGGTLPWQNSTPTLGINYDGTNVVLNWPNLYPNYLLACATNLCSSNWSVVPVPPSIVGDQWQVTYGPPAGAQYFRLQGQ